MEKYDLEDTNKDISALIISYRKNFSPNTANGVIHEIFDLCCSKYQLMDLWHGKLSDVSGTIISDKILARNLASDLERGRKFRVASLTFTYQMFSRTENLTT